MNETWTAIGAFGLAQQIFQALHGDLPALRIPAALRGQGVTIDLPRLNAHPARGELIRRSHGIEPLDESATRRIPALPRPQRQCTVRHERSQRSENFLSLNHCNPPE